MAVLVLGKARLAKSSSRPSCSYAGPPPRQQAIAPMAKGDPCPRWPIQSSRNPRWTEVAYRTDRGGIEGNAARRFLASRSDGERHHVGIDIYADPGDLVVSTESGRVVGIQPFYSGTWALLVQTDSGPVTLYGEIEKNSWRQFGIEEGSRVRRGQALARVGLMDSGSHMLHFEMYQRGITKNQRWYVGRKNPGLLDPTDYLLRARESVT